jgi:hypothetical protein
MGSWRETYEHLGELDKVSPLEPATLFDLAVSSR